jgi:hypothetical protein
MLLLYTRVAPSRLVSGTQEVPASSYGLVSIFRDLDFSRFSPVSPAEPWNRPSPFKSPLNRIHDLM